MEVPRGAVLLVGANAQGKTSLLEAVYFLSTFISFHATSDRQLVNFLAGREPLAVARIVADFCREGESHRIETRIIQESEGPTGGQRVRKEILVDGVKYKMSEVVGRFNAVLFTPHTLRVIEGPPEERRRYLNLVLAQVVPHYAAYLTEYSRVVSQRNALLKQIGERGGDPTQLAYWDERLTAAGARIIYARIQAVQEMERLAARMHQDLTRNGEVLRLAYEPSYDPLPQPDQQYKLPVDTPLDRSGVTLEEIQTGFLESIVRLREEEIVRGVTTIGPHRDELRFIGNGIDLGTYGSRGQVRTAVISLKLSEMAWMKEKSGHWPVFLLDEVLAELDAQRRADLLDRLGKSEQALLTTTDLDLFSPSFVEQASIWRIHRGRLVDFEQP
jgi:DNA replication and repair protein RecF